MANKKKTRGRYCPICGEENHCATANGEPSKTCWCMAYEFPDELLQRLREHEKTDGTACVCQNCSNRMKEECL